MEAVLSGLAPSSPWKTGLNERLGRVEGFVTVRSVMPRPIAGEQNHLMDGQKGEGDVPQEVRAAVWQSEGCRFDPTLGVSKCP